MTEGLRHIKLHPETKQRRDLVKAKMIGDAGVLLNDDEVENLLLDCYFKCRNKKETQKP